VDGNNCLFKTGQFGGAFAPIDGLKLDKSGTMKEFPDLVGNDDWREEAVKRFKDNIKKMDTEMDKINYIKEDLIKFGYVPMYLQQKGHRVKKL